MAINPYGNKPTIPTKKQPMSEAQSQLVKKINKYHKQSELDDIFEHIAQEEGLVNHDKKTGMVSPYMDPVGKQTIGYGTTGQGRTKAPVHIDTAKAWAKGDIKEFLAMAEEASPGLTNASASRRKAVASFVYNLGIGRYKRSAMKGYVDNGDWDSAAREMRKWVWGTVDGKKVKLPGLQKRRKKEAEMLLRD